MAVVVWSQDIGASSMSSHGPRTVGGQGKRRDDQSQELPAGSPASAELCNGLNLSKHGKFLQSGIGTEWLEGILGFLEKC